MTHGVWWRQGMVVGATKSLSRAVTRVPFSVGGAAVTQGSAAASGDQRGREAAVTCVFPAGALGTGRRGCASVAAGRGSHAWVPPSRLVVIGIVVWRDVCVKVGGGELARGAGGG